MLKVLLSYAREDGSEAAARLRSELRGVDAALLCYALAPDPSGASHVRSP